jgi:hypothetical protein
MGYNTNFSGGFEVKPEPLTNEMTDYLTMFNNTRRMRRNVKEFGIDGEFYVYGKGPFGQNEDETVVDGNMPPSTQPGLWCQWVPTSDGKHIVWDGGEKFYNYVEWLQYILENFLLPFDKYLDGEVIWQGEDIMDRGRIIADKDMIKIVSESGFERSIPLFSRSYFKKNLRINNHNSFSFEEKEKEISEYMEKVNIPEHMRDGVLNYVMNGSETGHFLSAIFSNDLVEAFSRADGINKEKIGDYVTLMYNCLPAGCWGSKDNYKEWIRNKGLEGH